MPSRTLIFDKKATPLYELANNYRNYIKWSPCSRLLAISGFGNLNGEIDIWDVEKLQKIGTNQSNCAVNL